MSESSSIHWTSSTRRASWTGCRLAVAQIDELIEGAEAELGHLDPPIGRPNRTRPLARSVNTGRLVAVEPIADRMVPSGRSRSSSSAFARHTRKPAAARPSGELVEQGGLADPGFPLDEDRDESPTLGATQAVLQFEQLRVAPPESDLAPHWRTP